MNSLFGLFVIHVSYFAHTPEHKPAHTQPRTHTFNTVANTNLKERIGSENVPYQNRVINSVCMSKL